MTELLEKAFSEATKLTPQQQDELAQWILETLEDEQRWDAAFAKSQDMLSRMAQDALKEHRAGETLPLDPDTL